MNDKTELVLFSSFLQKFFRLLLLTDLVLYLFPESALVPIQRKERLLFLPWMFQVHSL